MSTNTNSEELYVAHVDYDEARMLSDLASILQDLTFTIETCKRLVELLHQNAQDAVLVESLWTAALLRYVRCFATGKRFGLSEDILEGLPGDPVGTHRFYKNLRDKNIAHSVNPFEQVEVGLVLSPKDSNQREVLGVVTLAQRHICVDVGGVEQLARLANVVRKKVAELGKQVEERTLEFGKTIPLDQLYSRARVRTVAPGPEKAGEPRK